ncbi:winged helix-turn-helix domain-containing protein [Nocardioides albidus]|uniref:Winged helix-turn-helix domain-containing protein n=1 Tax=Nocardioides albidus TaxID=1517589 RepID=A0A5C4W3B5_9ACTN|nr:crosslink repair DNA glycosylase YcaQ family protein [Nocardioides albidus]TNM42701.1 winged helix-turn-helix domain-containing protein [Nocardioides albidus]
MIRLDREQARRIAVRAQLLDAQRPLSLVSVVDQLTLVQIDPTTAIVRSADLVAWSRLGDAYDPSDLVFALETERSLTEHVTFIRTMDDIGIHLAVADEWIHPSTTAWVAANPGYRERLLAHLRDEGPLTPSALPNDPEVPYASTGWNDDKNTQRMLEVLCLRGEVAVAGRQGRSRRWDLAERVYPEDLYRPGPDEARRLRDERRLASLGIARAKPMRSPGEPSAIGELGETVEVDGVPGTWQVDPDALAASAESFEGRCAFLSPFDRLVYDRDRALDLFGFEYVLEMYKPAAQRRWGYFALPIVYGDRLVGKLDAKADRKAGVLRVNAIHEDFPWDPEIGDAVDEELTALATWLGLDLGRT